MTDRKKVKIILIGDRYYSGEIISEDDYMIKIKDKFGNEVLFGKPNIVSMEILE